VRKHSGAFVISRERKPELALKLQTNSSAPLWITPISSSCEVYLDHWALRDISCTPKLRERFLKALIGRNGGVQLSAMNILEFSKVTDTMQVQAAEEFLDELCPDHIGFIEIVPKTVIERENCILQGKPIEAAPHVDLKLIQYFATKTTGTIHPLSFRGFFSQAPKLQEMCETFMNELEQPVLNAKEKARKPQYAKAISQVPRPDSRVLRATRYIDLMAARYLVKENIKIMPRNWRDFFHMIVPLAYCDFVLLDKAWVSIATQIQNRLRRNGHNTLSAQMFSQRTLEDFIAALEFRGNST
jgi:hypothetical protein